MKRTIQVSSVCFLVVVLSSFFFWGCEENLLPTDPGDLDAGGIFGVLGKSGEINYDIITFGTLPGHSSSWAVDINDHGGIVGTSWNNGRNPDLSSRIFRWSTDALQDLGDGEPNGINNAGDIVGWTRDSGLFVQQESNRIFLHEGVWNSWRADQMINNSGTVAGLLQIEAGINEGGVWDSPYAEPTLLGFPAACIEDESYECAAPTPYAINDNGDVVGVIPVTYTSDSGDIVTYALAAIWHAGSYDNPVWMPRYPYGTLHRHARGVNNAGWVVGAMALWQAVVWIPNTEGEYPSATVLPHFGSGNGLAYAVSEPDNNGTVRIVGEADNRAALWIVDQAGNVNGPIDLGRPQRYTNAEARSINADGWIVGRASNNRGSIAVLWKPVDESGGPGDPEGHVIVDAIEYSTHGGKDKNNHLSVGVSLVYDNGSPAANISVSIALYRNGQHYESRTGTSGSNGTASFTFNNAPGGSYTTVVIDVEGDWNGETPENGFEK